MRLRRLASAIGVAVGIASGPLQAAVFCNFEAPTYTANTTFDGVDGWFASASARVTPLPGYPQVLEGSQSGWMANTSAKRVWNAEVKPYIGTNDTYISWLVDRPYGFGRSEFYFSDNIAGAATPGGIVLGSGGDIRIFAASLGGEATTGVNYQTNTIYRFGMLFDFTNNTFKAFVENVTAATPQQSLGTYTMFGGPKNTTSIRNNGGIFLFDSPGATATIWDDIQVIPEPSAAMLLALGGLLAWQTSRRRSNGVAE
jgi:hypothetical protein